jgi:hypothetical protein
VSGRTPAHAYVAGSLLRPPSLGRAVEAFYADGHSAVLADERGRDRSAASRAPSAAGHPPAKSYRRTFVL